MQNSCKSWLLEADVKANSWQDKNDKLLCELEQLNLKVLAKQETVDATAMVTTASFQADANKDMEEHARLLEINAGGDKENKDLKSEIQRLQGGITNL